VIHAHDLRSPVDFAKDGCDLTITAANVEDALGTFLDEARRMALNIVAKDARLGDQSIPIMLFVAKDIEAGSIDWFFGYYDFG